MFLMRIGGTPEWLSTYFFASAASKMDFKAVDWRTTSGAGGFPDYSDIFADMNASEFSQMIIKWRHKNGLRQADMAKLLSVSQGTVSKWEAGAEVPTVKRLKELTAFLQEHKAKPPYAVDVAFVSLQSDVRALFEHQEARLLAVSEGLRKLWPSFATLVGVEMRQHLVGETRLIYDDAKLAARIRMREVAVIVGVSERHVTLSPDEPVRHKWMLAFRHYAGHTLAEMVYEPCDSALPVGIQQIITV